MAKQGLVRQSLKDQIKGILIDRMIEGTLTPGDRIKELQIANEFGTSQAPVREAIQCLETLGYIEHIPHVGATVKSFNRTEVEEAYQVREALEVYAVLHIGGQVEKLVQELIEHLGAMKHSTTTDDVRQFVQADNRFHRAIVESSSNETMLSTWDSLRMQLQVIATLVEASMPLAEIYALHPPIVKALNDKLYDETAQLLRGHYKGISDYWKSI